MNKKLRVFEAFAGIGAQYSALERANINFEVVGISEWFINALSIYGEIHKQNEVIDIPSREAQIEYLKQYTFSRDSVNPIRDINKLTDNELENLFMNNIRCKNYGSITEITAEKMPDCDLLIYSFPCQDLSTGGKTKGMGKGSGTRSGLLWEIERILLGLKEKNRLPQYLLMENVKTIFAESNKKDLNQWLDFLESIGYKNSKNMILNSIKFGIPQDRKRAFIISHLDTIINVDSIENHKVIEPTISKFLRINYDDQIFKAEANAAQLNNTISRSKMWKINKKDVDAPHINTITCNMDRSNTAAMFEYTGPKGTTYRLLTIREAFLFMGFTEAEYIAATGVGLSYRKMNKLIGNSIVVNVLEVIFKELFSKEYGKK